MKLSISRLWDGSPATSAEVVEFSLGLGEEGLVFALDAPFFGDPSPSVPPGTTPGLWDYEVVEFFLAGAEDRYLEVELGPFGHHLVLQLCGQRQVVQQGLDLNWRVERVGGRWLAYGLLPWEWIPEPPHRLNLYAIHGRGVERRYLCWRPCLGDQPDFHRLEVFEPVSLDALGPLEVPSAIR